MIWATRGRARAGLEQAAQDGRAVAGGAAGAGVGDVGQDVDAALRGGHRLGDGVGDRGRVDGEVGALLPADGCASSSA